MLLHGPNVSDSYPDADPDGKSTIHTRQLWNVFINPKVFYSQDIMISQPVQTPDVGRSFSSNF